MSTLEPIDEITHTQIIFPQGMMLECGTRLGQVTVERSPEPLMVKLQTLPSGVVML